MASDIEVPKTVLVHGYLTVEGKKISKSLGTAIDPNDIIDKYGVDPVRYFLVKNAVALISQSYTSNTILTVSAVITMTHSV